MSPSGQTLAPSHEATHVLVCGSQVFGASQSTSTKHNSGCGQRPVCSSQTRVPGQTPVSTQLGSHAPSTQISPRYTLVRSAKTHRAYAISTAIWVTNAAFTRVVNTARVYRPISPKQTTVGETITNTPRITIFCHQTTLTHLRQSPACASHCRLPAQTGPPTIPQPGEQTASTQFHPQHRPRHHHSERRRIGWFLHHRPYPDRKAEGLADSRPRTRSMQTSPQGADAIVVVDTPWRCFTLCRHGLHTPPGQSRSSKHPSTHRPEPTAHTCAPGQSALSPQRGEQLKFTQMVPSMPRQSASSTQARSGAHVLSGPQMKPLGQSGSC